MVNISIMVNIAIANNGSQSLLLVNSIGIEQVVGNYHNCPNPNAYVWSMAGFGWVS